MAANPAALEDAAVPVAPHPAATSVKAATSPTT